MLGFWVCVCGDPPYLAAMCFIDPWYITPSYSVYLSHVIKSFPMSYHSLHILKVECTLISQKIYLKGG